MKGFLRCNSFLRGFNEVVNKLTFNKGLVQRKGIKHGKVSRDLAVILAAF